MPVSDIKEKNGYMYHRVWFDFSFENNDIVSPTHTAMYLWLVELNNRMGWSEKFASPASQTMSAIGLKSYNTYKKIFTDLIEFGFVKLLMESKNQYTACIIALSNFDNAQYNALDKALIKNTPKQSEITIQSIDSINKQVNIKPKTKNIFVPPIELEVINYFNENGYSEISAKKAFSYYNEAKWKDSNGKQVLSWKQKMISVWFKQENKIKEKHQATLSL